MADYYGITYEKVEATGGVFWPCPTLEHPGTPRPFEGGRFYHPDGKARFIAVEWRPPAEPPDEAYPLRLTTGRTVAHFLSGNQTRRLPGLVEQTPRPWVEVHLSLGFADGDLVRVVTRRGAVTYPALVTEAIRRHRVRALPLPGRWPPTCSPSTPSTRSPRCPSSRCAPAGSSAARRSTRSRAAHAARGAPVPARDGPLAEQGSPTSPQGRGTAES